MEHQQRVMLQHSSDEIDLFDVFQKIWDGRVVIAGIVLVSAIVAFTVIKMSTSYYSIVVTLDKTSADQLRPLVPSLLGSNEYQVPAPDEKKIYDKILLQSNSISLLKAFWEKKTGTLLDLTPGAQKTDELKAFLMFSQSFVLEASNPKMLDATARKITIEHESQLDGIALLNEYLVFLNQWSWNELSQKLEASYDANLNALDVSYKAQNSIEQRKLSDTLINLQESFKIAESLGIKETPFKELENIQLKVLDSRDYLLGSKTLKQQIDILVARQGKSLAPFSGELRKMEVWRDQMNTDLQRMKALDGKKMLFSVVNRPESSLAPVKPKKALIFIAVVILSGFCGVFFVLIRSAFKKHNAITR